MSDADLYLLKESIKLVESKVFRDYVELGNLQTTNHSLQFLNKTVEFLNKKFFNFFTEKRPNYKIKIKGFNNLETSDENKTKNSIYINSVCGLRNLLHHIPYFVTMISLFNEDKIVASVVNSYSTNEIFFVAENKGVFINDRKVRVSNRNLNDNSLIGVKYSSKSKKTFLKLVSKLTTFRIGNCSILDSCYTSCGRYDANFIFDSSKEEIDSCELFIREAGGLNYRMSDNSVLFSNSTIYENLKKIVIENA